MLLLSFWQQSPSPVEINWSEIALLKHSIGCLQKGKPADYNLSRGIDVKIKWTENSNLRGIVFSRENNLEFLLLLLCRCSVLVFYIIRRHPLLKQCSNQYLIVIMKKIVDKFKFLPHYYIFYIWRKFWFWYRFLPQCNQNFKNWTFVSLECHEVLIDWDGRLMYKTFHSIFNYFLIRIK